MERDTWRTIESNEGFFTRKGTAARSGITLPSKRIVKILIRKNQSYWQLTSPCMQTNPELPKVGRSLGSDPSLIDNPHSTNKKVRPSPLSSVKLEYPSLPLRPFRAHRRARVFEWNNSLEDGKVKDSPVKQASGPEDQITSLSTL